MKRFASLHNARAFGESIGNSTPLLKDSSHLKLALEKLSIFHELELRKQEDLFRLGHVVTASNGTVLFREGDAPERCYIILSGKVDLSCAMKDDAMSACSTTASSNSSSRVPSSRSRSDSLGTSRCSSRRSSLAREGASFGLLNNVAKSLAQAVERHECDGLDYYGACSVSLGAGRLFGDFAFLQQTLQGCTASCTDTCELYVIDRIAFEQVLKEDLQRLTCEKLAFLKAYLPGMKSLCPQMVEPLLHCFQKKLFPKGRVICTQSVMAKKSLYLLSKGSVFLSCTDANLPTSSSELRKMGSLFTGSVFGCLEDNLIQPCTVSCTSSCEAFVASGRYLQVLPPSVRQSVKKYLSQTTEWCPEGAGDVPLDASRKPDEDRIEELERMIPMGRKRLRRASEPLTRRSTSLSMIGLASESIRPSIQRPRRNSSLSSLTGPI
jgi:CRP-like cAMP-binding protein